MSRGQGMAHAARPAAQQQTVEAASGDGRGRETVWYS